MKKLITSLIFITVSVIGFSQGVFKPVSLFPTVNESRIMLANGETPITSKWETRFDATFQFAEVNYNKVLKYFETNMVIGIGPAIGFQHYVPKSSIDPTPFNNYGFSGGTIFGEKFKFVLQANAMELFKAGVTITPNPMENLSIIGFFIGAGITF
jgi:hypothetical protein